MVVLTRENRGGSAQHTTRATPTRSSHGPMEAEEVVFTRENRGGSAPRRMGKTCRSVQRTRLRLRRERIPAMMKQQVGRVLCSPCCCLSLHIVRPNTRFERYSRDLDLYTLKPCKCELASTQATRATTEPLAETAAAASLASCIGYGAVGAPTLDAAGLYKSSATHVLCWQFVVCWNFEITLGFPECQVVKRTQSCDVVT